MDFRSGFRRVITFKPYCEVNQPIWEFASLNDFYDGLNCRGRKHRSSAQERAFIIVRAVNADAIAGEQRARVRQVALGHDRRLDGLSVMAVLVPAGLPFKQRMPVFPIPC